MKQKRSVLLTMKMLLATIMILLLISNVTEVSAAETLTYAGDTKETATQLQYNDTGYYSTKSYKNGDWYVFQTPDTPGYTNIYFKNTGMNNYAKVYVYTFIDEIIEKDTWVSYNDTSNFNLKLERNQVYYIEIIEGTLGSTYILDLDFTPDMQGNSKSDAVEVNCNTEYTWSIDGNDDMDYAVFTATKTGKHQLYFKNTGVNASMNMWLYNYDTDETLCKERYISTNYTYTETLNLEKGQKYYFCTNSNSFSTGKYVFSINNQSVESIKLSKPILAIDSGATAKLSATVVPSTAYETSVTWASNNTNIASVSSDGTVSAWSAGETIITCTANDGSGVISTCNVIVKPSEISTIYRDYLKASSSSFYISWNSVSNASGYTVYCYDTKAKKYVAVKSVGKDTLNTTIKEVKVNGKSTKLSPATTYKVKVAAYVLIEGKKYYGPKTDASSFITAPGKTKITSINYSNSNITLKWNKVNGADGYEVYVKRPNSDTYYCVATLNKSTTKYSYSNYWNGQGQYSFKIKAYKKMNYDSFVGAASAVKTIKVK